VTASRRPRGRLARRSGEPPARVPRGLGARSWKTRKEAARVETIGVIGAGVMGVGVAQDLAQHGMQVILIDVDEARLIRPTIVRL
jgi:phosphoglycerate dehydrogenase-like enzyme